MRIIIQPTTTARVLNKHIYIYVIIKSKKIKSFGILNYRSYLDI